MVLDILGVEEPDPVHLGSCAAFPRVYELSTSKEVDGYFSAIPHMCVTSLSAVNERDE